MAGPCRCCCPQINVINNSPSVTTVKVSPDGGIVWYFDSGHVQNSGHLVVDRYFALGITFSAGSLLNGKMALLGLDGSLVNDTAVPSGAEISLSGGNIGLGSTGTLSGGVAFVGSSSTSADINRASFWDVNGVYTGTWTDATDIVSDVGSAGDNICLRMDTGAGASKQYLWIDPTGTQVGSEPNVSDGGDTIDAGTVLGIGSQVMIGGAFDVNGNGTYQSATDHRFRLYGDAGAPEDSGVASAVGTATFMTRYGTNSYVICATSSGITKITTGLSVSHNSISGFGESGDAVNDVKEDSSGNVAIASNVTLYHYPQTGGAPNWTASFANIRNLGCDQNGNIYAWAGQSLKKYNSSGSLQWTVTVPSKSSANHIPTGRRGLWRHTGMHVDSDGFIYLTGTRMLAANLG